jgi:hypothetical protein
MVRRFALAFLAFVGIIVPGTFGFAVLAAPPATPATSPPGCDRSLATANSGVAVMQSRLKSLSPADKAEVCTATRLYFLEVVKARAVTAVCKTGIERDRDLGRLDADVEHINEAIAARCA